MKIFGGLLLSNLLAQNEHFDFLLSLFEKDIIHGTQLRVDHPSYTSGVTINLVEKAINGLPEEFKVFIHLASDTHSFDPGQTFDNQGMFTLPDKDRTKWENWNLETIEWCLKVLNVIIERQGELWPCSGVVHPGHGTDINNDVAYEKMLKVLRRLDGKFSLEATYALIDGGLQSKARPLEHGTSWQWKGAGDRFWSFGGTPDDMTKLLSHLGSKWKCLIDFSHLMVTTVQATMLNLSELQPWKSLEKIVADYMNLPYLKICHFSGAVETPYGNHDGFGIIPTPLPVLEGLRQMKTICLEIPWDPDKEEEIVKKVENFREELS